MSITEVVEWLLALQSTLDKCMFCFKPLTTFGLGGLQGPIVRGMRTPAIWLRNNAASFQANE